MAVHGTWKQTIGEITSGTSGTSSLASWPLCLFTLHLFCTSIRSCDNVSRMSSWTQRAFCLELYHLHSFWPRATWQGSAYSPNLGRWSPIPRPLLDYSFKEATLFYSLCPQIPMSFQTSLQPLLAIPGAFPGRDEAEPRAAKHAG